MSARSRRRPGGHVATLAALVSSLSFAGLLTAPAAQAAAEKTAAAGEINVIANHSGLCVEVENSSLQAGAAVVQADCTGQPGEVWRLQESPAGAGAVNVVNAHSNQCLEAASGAIGAAIRQGTCSGQPAVSFRLVDRGVHVWLQPLSASPAACLEVPSGAVAPGTALRLAECLGQAGTGFYQRAPQTGNDPVGGPQTGMERLNVAGDGSQIPEGLSTGENGNHHSNVSADGRFVVFDTNASGLVAGDSNVVPDVFLRDRVTGTIEIVSRKTSGAQIAAGGTRPSVSADGRYVVFQSADSSLAPGDANHCDDVFVRDRQTGITEVVSRSATGQIGDEESGRASISADGRYVTFASASANLVPGDTNNTWDVFLRDRQTGTIERVSLTDGDAQANGSSMLATVSADGRYIAFVSMARNLTPGSGNPVGMYQIFVRDRQTGATDLVSVSTAGVPGHAGAHPPSISANGRYVAFASDDGNLAPGDTNNRDDVFVRDRTVGATVRVSVGPTGAQAAQNSNRPTISADGKHVAFVSEADSLVAYDTNNAADVFVRDLTGDVTRRVSVNGSGAQGDAASPDAKISANGQFVLLRSNATNLIANDTNGAHDLFMRSRPVT